MIQISITNTEYQIIQAFLELTEVRKQEVSINKKTNINAFSISKHIGKSYNTVKNNLTNLKQRL